MLQINTAKNKIEKPESDFHNPLGLLSDCHRRVEKFLEQIIRVCEVVRGGELEPAQYEALAVALRYFRQAAPLHTADEENSLFPRLRERAADGDEAAQEALDVIDRLEDDHDTADERHALIDKLGARWLEESTLDAPDSLRLEGEARYLRAFYATHIAVEDNELFPLAGQVLSGNAVENIGREMAARRGLDFDNLPAGSSCVARKAARQELDKEVHKENIMGQTNSVSLPVNNAALTEQTIGQLVAERPERAQVFEKLGVDYCCGGKKLLADACREQGLDLAKVTEALASSDAVHPADGTDWTRASLSELADHIIATHHDYLRAELPRLSVLTERVKNAHGASHPELIELDTVFNAMRAGLEEHTMKEETVLFPCIKQLDRGEAPTGHCSVSRAVAVMEAEHEEAGDGLQTIRALTGDFTPPTDTCNTHRVLLSSLQALESDMHRHVHKENSILFPRAVAREKELLQ